MKAAKKMKDMMQDKYDEYGNIFDEWGPENPYYNGFGVKTKDGLLIQSG